MLRVHFTPNDLTRVRILDEPHPLWEVLLSLHMLQTRHGAVVFGGWRRNVQSALRPSTRALMALARPRGYSPDFLTPVVDKPDLETALDAFLSTDRTTLRRDLRVLAAEAPVPTWTNLIADGDSGALKGIAEAMRGYYRSSLAPYWPAIRAHVHADRRRRAELVVGNGLERMLTALHPEVRQYGQVLELPYPVEKDMYLRGRGLTLIPSFFCWHYPITLADADREPVLVYPVDRSIDWTSAVGDAEAPHTRSLVALLGRTRAAVLLAIAERPNMNTSEIAASLGTSPANASQHATVLREAGLVITRRHNGSALHALSARGTVLLALPFGERSA